MARVALQWSTAFVLAMLLIGAGGAVHPASLVAQNEADAVMAPVKGLFDAMRTRDSVAARAVFHPEARLVGTGVRDGRSVVQVNAIDGFIAAIGRDREVWDERIWDWEVRIAHNLATVWTKYDFLRAGAFSHCGVDAFQLVRTDDGWKIVQVADTRRREGCEAPSGTVYPRGGR